MATTSISPVGRLGLALPSGRMRDLTDDPQAELRAQRVCHLLVADDDLGHAAAVAQIDERDATVIAATRHPTRQA